MNTFHSVYCISSMVQNQRETQQGHLKVNSFSRFALLHFAFFVFYGNDQCK